MTENEVIPVGPSKAVSERIRALRQAAGKSVAALADEVAATGVPMTRDSLGNIEYRGRPVTVEELWALAYVLNISPSELCLPARRRQEDGTHVMSAPIPEESNGISAVRRWLQGREPLSRQRYPVDYEGFFRNGGPEAYDEWKAEQHAAAKAATGLGYVVREMAADEYSMSPDLILAELQRNRKVLMRYLDAFEAELEEEVATIETRRAERSSKQRKVEDE